MSNFSANITGRPRDDRPIRSASRAKRIAKRALHAVAASVGLVVVALLVFVRTQTSAYDASMDKIYEVPVLAVGNSTNPAAIARGKHLVEAVAGCAAADCHGSDLSGGRTVSLGPVGSFTGPNITAANVGAAYSDGELARLIRHGIKKDGLSVRFMPVQDFSWMPDGDVAAIVSYLRQAPPVDKPNGPTEFRTLGKVLDRKGMIVIDVARRIDHNATESVPSPSPNAEYGRFLARGCSGCHGERLSGGPIPGAPKSMPVPLNLTPDKTGLAEWTYADFDRLLATGTRKNGAALNPFMPYESYAKLDDVEKHALWAYLQSIPPTPFGQR